MKDEYDKEKVIISIQLLLLEMILFISISVFGISVISFITLQEKIYLYYMFIFLIISNIAQSLHVVFILETRAKGYLILPLFFCLYSKKENLMTKQELKEYKIR